MYQPNIEDAIKNNPELQRKVQSFENYVAQVRAKKLADKMLVDNLLLQLVEAKAAPVINTNIDEVKKLVNDLRPTIDKISENTIFVKSIYTKDKTKTSKAKPKETTNERKMRLKHAILTRGKK